MSYQGYGSTYVNNFDTVDEVADYTDMQGAASVMNHQTASRRIADSPTKSLIALWVLAVLVYLLLMFFFRRNLA